jgi:polyhydroxybutyrate depolymerase
MLKFLIALIFLSLPAFAEMREVRLGDRFYLIDLPVKAKGAPLLMALHGGGGDPRQFASASGLGPAATRQGYAVIFPAGTGRQEDRLLTWNGGYCCASAARRGVDDIGFLTSVIEDATQKFGLNGTRVYMTGMSNGSIMAETYAARMPGKIRAVAGIAGTMDTSATRVAGPVPLLIIHGTADEMVRYEGGRGERSLTRTDFASVDDVVQAFLSPWPATLSTTTHEIDARDDGTSITVTDYSNRTKVVLRLMTVIGGGHHWPGGRKARQDTGNTQEIAANAELLRFFALHP